MEIVAPARLRRAEQAHRFRSEVRGPLALLAGLHRRLGQHRDAAHPAGPVAAGRQDDRHEARPGWPKLIDSASEAAEFGRSTAAGGRRARRRLRGSRARPTARAPRRTGPRRPRRMAARPARDADELEAAAALCRSAGYWALAYPVAERLARPADLDADGLVVVGRPPAVGRGRRARPALGGGRRSTAGAVSRGPPAAAAHRGVRVRRPGSTSSRPTATGPAGPGARPGPAVLDAARDAGPGDGADLGLHPRPRAVRPAALAVSRACSSSSPTPRWSAAASRSWPSTRCGASQDGSPDALDDALALRLAAIEAAGDVFRVAHQLHGAIGLLRREPLSWLSRYSQPLRRLPLGLSATLAS